MQGYENYDLQEEDPYLLSGSTCLINRLGITNTQALKSLKVISFFCLTERSRMCLLRYLISCTKIAFFVSWI